MIHKEGLAMEAFKQVLIMLQLIVKNLLLVLKSKRKINYNQVRKKVVDWEGGENRKWYIQRNWKEW